MKPIYDKLLSSFAFKFNLRHYTEEPEPVNARDKYGWTPLHAACYGGHAEVAAALLAQGARAGKTTKAGRCSLIVSKPESTLKARLVSVIRVLA